VAVIALFALSAFSEATFESKSGTPKQRRVTLKQARYKVSSASGLILDGYANQG
jgi:hypothetical protein